MLMDIEGGGCRIDFWKIPEVLWTPYSPGSSREECFTKEHMGPA
jgi:hypothetical protein